MLQLVQVFAHFDNLQNLIDEPGSSRSFHEFLNRISLKAAYGDRAFRACGG